MQLLTLCILTVAVCGGGGVTKTSGIEQFWTDDYKVFDQVYGKTSDKDIYGASLPPPVHYRPVTPQASEKKERYQLNYDENLFNSYDLGDRYKEFQAKSKVKSKPATSSSNFISYAGFKPISQTNDPDTYNYLKHLEHYDKHADFPPTVDGFKPYSSYFGTNPGDTDSYKSIQDILDTHEYDDSNNRLESDNLKYLTHSKSKIKKPTRNRGYSKPRCVTGRCRKRTSTMRYGARPYIRRSKPRVVKF